MARYAIDGEVELAVGVAQSADIDEILDELYDSAKKLRVRAESMPSNPDHLVVSFNGQRDMSKKKIARLHKVIRKLAPYAVNPASLWFQINDRKQILALIGSDETDQRSIRALRFIVDAMKNCSDEDLKSLIETAGEMRISKAAAAARISSAIDDGLPDEPYAGPGRALARSQFASHGVRDF